MMNRRRYGMAAAIMVALALAAHPAFAQGMASCTPSAGGVLDTLSQKFSSGTSGWMSTAQGYAKEIFGRLAVIEFVWAAAQYTLQKNELGELITSVLFKVMALSFFFMLITEAPTWMPAIIHSFTAMGQGIGTGSSLPTIATGVISPSGVMSMGTCLAGNIMRRMDFLLRSARRCWPCS